MRDWFVRFRIGLVLMACAVLLGAGKTALAQPCDDLVILGGTACTDIHARCTVAGIVGSCEDVFVGRLVKTPVCICEPPAGGKGGQEGGGSSQGPPNIPPNINDYRFDLPPDPTRQYTIELPESLGSGILNVPDVSGHFDVHIEPTGDPSGSNVIVRLVSMDITVGPLDINGLAIGPSHVALAQDGDNDGTGDLATGDFALQTTVRITNSHFTERNPIIAYGNGTGHYNAATGGVTWQTGGLDIAVSPPPPPTPTGGSLRRYILGVTTIAEFNTANPTVNMYPPGNTGLSETLNKAVIDDHGTNNPVLKRLVLVQENETSVAVAIPSSAGFIFLSMLSEQGPRKGLTFTGTGTTMTTIAWGLVTGWTVTGSFYCHSSPSYICTYARGSDLATLDPMFPSSFYDLGTWTFHGTGFTSVPYVQQVAGPSSGSIGNASYWLKGRLAGGFIPALPVLGVALLGASLLFAGARLSRKR